MIVLFSFCDLDGNTIRTNMCAKNVLDMLSYILGMQGSSLIKIQIETEKKRQNVPRRNMQWIT